MWEKILEDASLPSPLLSRLESLSSRFKGGNSLLLLLSEPQRFSIDVDIVTTASKDAMIELVEGIVKRCNVFTRQETRAPKTKPWLPMISFKLFFESQYQKPEDAYVMLDAVLEPPPYGGVERSVTCLDVYESEQRVEVPFVVRPATGIGPNAGGAMEVVVPSGMVKMRGFTMLE